MTRRTEVKHALGAAGFGGSVKCPACGSLSIAGTVLDGAIHLLCEECNTRFAVQTLELPPEKPVPEELEDGPEDGSEQEEQSNDDDELDDCGGRCDDEESDDEESDDEEADGKDESEDDELEEDEDEAEEEEQDELVGGSGGAIAEVTVINLTPSELDDARTRTFYRRIGSVMRDNLNDRRVGGFRSGKLDARRLAKVGVGSDRVFTKPEARLHKGYDVVLLVDCSGSMDAEVGSGGPSRIAIAAELARMMVKGLTQHNIDVAVVCHNRAVATIRPFGSKKTADEVHAGILHHFQKHTGDNSDYAALRCIQTMLEERRHLGYQPIVMAICDGKLFVNDIGVREPKAGGRIVDNVLGHSWADDRPVHLQPAARDGRYAISTEHTGQCQFYAGFYVKTGVEPSDTRGEGDWEPGNFRFLQVTSELEQRGAFITISIDCPEASLFYPNVHVVRDREQFIGTALRELTRAVVRG